MSEYILLDVHRALLKKKGRKRGSGKVKGGGKVGGREGSGGGVRIYTS